MNHGRLYFVVYTSKKDEVKGLLLHLGGAGEQAATPRGKISSGTVNCGAHSEGDDASSCECCAHN